MGPPSEVTAIFLSGRRGAKNFSDTFVGSFFAFFKQCLYRINYFSGAASFCRRATLRVSVWKVLKLGRPTMEPCQKLPRFQGFFPWSFGVPRDISPNLTQFWPCFDEFWPVLTYFAGQAWPIFTYSDLFAGRTWPIFTYFDLFRFTTRLNGRDA